MFKFELNASSNKYFILHNVLPLKYSLSYSSVYKLFYTSTCMSRGFWLHVLLYIYRVPELEGNKHNDQWEEHKKNISQKVESHFWTFILMNRLNTTQMTPSDNSTLEERGPQGDTSSTPASRGPRRLYRSSPWRGCQAGEDHWWRGRD